MRKQSKFNPRQHNILRIRRWQRDTFLLFGFEGQTIVQGDEQERAVGEGAS